jgi:hypothetical protein
VRWSGTIGSRLAQAELYLGRVIAGYAAAFEALFLLFFFFLDSFTSDYQPDGWPSADTTLLTVCAFI